MRGNLYLQSEYSLQLSLMKIAELIKAAKDFKYDFLALTDNSLYGSYELFKLAKAAGIKPILGLEVIVELPEKEIFLVYVKNQKGYQNLLKLNLLIEENTKLSLDDLVENQEGLIFVSGGYFSIIDQTIIYGNEDMVINYLEKYQNIFTDFYVGLGTNHLLQTKTLKPYLLNLQKQLNFKILPIHQTNYLDKSDKETYELLLKIKGSHSQLLELDLSFKETENSYQLLDFINSIDFDLKFPNYEMPKYLEDGNDVDFLRNLASRGLARRLKLNSIKDDGTYQERLNYELDVIISKGFTNYFLIVYDFILFAKQNDILVGPGRGSASGSLVSYVLGITEVDPIKYNLLFERFLNVERVKMPDIDIDFPDSKRSFVIDYVENKYGSDNIASITTFDTFQTKSSIRDVSRALDIPLNRVTAILNAVASKRVDESDDLVANVLKHANKLNGLIRHTGTHPAGIIISKQSLKSSIPLKNGAYNFKQIGYDASVLESLGFNKIDFLGIRNLTIISDVISYLNEDGIKINLNNLPLNDRKTYDLLSKSYTNGVFQLESAGMQKVLRKLQPSEFEDLVATLALFRPGPMANIDVYIDRKKGAKFNYLDQELEEILKPTYGIIIYQEQIMQIANKFAAYSMLEADNLRVGMGKKDLKVLEGERRKFISGANKLGHDSLLAEEIFELILKFADYGFNRSHSVAYGLVAYQMAYLKANHFDYFMRALLNSASGSVKQTLEYLQEIKHRKIKIHVPHINKSTNSYLIKEGHLLMPLTSIKSINNQTANLIITERNKGFFKTFEEVKQRLNGIISETQLVHLVNAGALDSLNKNHQTMLANASFDGGLAKQFIKDYVIRDLEEFDFTTLSKNEHEALGFNVLYDFTSMIESKNIEGYLVSKIEKTKKVFNVIGIISRLTEHYTKNNKKMIFMTLSDYNLEIDITVFSEQVELLKPFKINDQVVVNVSYSVFKDKDSYTLNKISPIL